MIAISFSPFQETDLIIKFSAINYFTPKEVHTQNIMWKWIEDVNKCSMQCHIQIEILNPSVHHFCRSPEVWSTWMVEIQCNTGCWTRICSKILPNPNHFVLLCYKDSSKGIVSNVTLVYLALIQLFCFGYKYTASQCIVQTYSMRKMYLLTAKPAVTNGSLKNLPGQQKLHSSYTAFTSISFRKLHFPTSRSLERNTPSKCQYILNFTGNSTAKLVCRYFC